MKFNFTANGVWLLDFNVIRLAQLWAVALSFDRWHHCLTSLWRKKTASWWIAATVILHFAALFPKILAKWLCRQKVFSSFPFHCTQANNILKYCDRMRSLYSKHVSFLSWQPGTLPRTQLRYSSVHYLIKRCWIKGKRQGRGDEERYGGEETSLEI